MAAFILDSKMPKMKAKVDAGTYGTYSQYAFRSSRHEIEAIQEQMNALYTKFNKGRDPKAPQGRRAVKVGDIALEALKIGIATLQKRNKWDFEGN